MRKADLEKRACEGSYDGWKKHPLSARDWYGISNFAVDVKWFGLGNDSLDVFPGEL